MKKTLVEHPEVTEETALQLIGLIQTENTDSYPYAVDVLLKIAETDPVLLQHSPEVFIKILLQPDDVTDVKTLLKVLEIISVIALIDTGKLKPAIPALLKKLNNANSSVRSASYYVLDIIAKPHPEFFSDYALELIRGLHGLNIDERVYAAKLIGEIASGSPNIIKESYDVLHDLAYKHPDSRVRAATYDVLKKFNIKKPDDETDEKPDNGKSDEKLEFETDFIGLNQISSQTGDFEALTDELSERIKGIDFEQSASQMLNSMGMGHLIVKSQKKKAASKVQDEKKTSKPQKAVEEAKPDSGFYSIEQITALKADDVQMEPEIETSHNHSFMSIKQLVTDPDIKSRLSSVKDITLESDLDYDTELRDVADQKTAPLTSDQPPDQKVIASASKTVPVKDEIIERTPAGQLSDLTVEMVYAILAELSNEDWISNVALTDSEGQLITASDPGSLGESILKKTCDMLNLEKSMSNREGTRSRVKIELSDHLLVALSLTGGFILIAFSRTDVEFEKVLYKLNRTSEKLERIIG